MALKGIDISKHNLIHSFEMIKQSGIDFIILRAGAGTTIDSKFTAYATAAISAGIPIGIYYFGYPLSTSDAVREADYCYKFIKSFKISLPVYYDFEDNSDEYAISKGKNFTKEERTAIIKAFAERIRSYGCTPGIYSNPNYIMYKTNFSELSKYPLWLAKWVYSNKNTTFEEVSDARVTNSYGNVAIWQFGKSNQILGINGDVDVNYGYFNLPKVAESTAIIKMKYRPVEKLRYTSYFGERWADLHRGVDIGAEVVGRQGDSLFATTDGIIRRVKVDPSYGNYIVIEHSGWCTLYAHLQSFNVKVGQKVKAGDVVGFMGTTGDSSGAHLHFECRLCPYVKFDERGTVLGFTNKPKWLVDPKPYIDAAIPPKDEKDEPIIPAAVKRGDKVKIINTTTSKGVTRGKIYGGGTFVIYYDTYDVISVSDKRVVVGIGNAITAAVNIDNIKKI